MPIRPCPACSTPSPRHMEGISATAVVNYYRCPECFHIWTVDKLDPTKITHVTPLPEQQPK
jgi:hypothetical protein